VACIGPRTAFDARAAGLTVHLIAEERSAVALVEALVDHVEATHANAAAQENHHD
jgi:uroporphyrinogen-III synthase